MKNRLFALLAVLSFVFFAIMVSGCMDTSSQSQDTFSFGPRMFTSLYEYHVQLLSDSPIYNATFIIPLPVKNGTPVAGIETLTADDFQQPGTSVSLTQSPPGLNLSTAVSLPAGYQPWFAVITADMLAPVNDTDVVFTVNKYNNSKYTRLTNYRFVPNPIGYEALIVPKLNFTWKDPRVAEIRPDVIRYKTYNVPQNTLIFAGYHSTPSAHITVAFSYSVLNGWFQGFGDDSYENYYQESFSEQFNGEQQGWHLVSGSIQVERSSPFHVP